LGCGIRLRDIAALEPGQVQFFRHRGFVESDYPFLGAWDQDALDRLDGADLADAPEFGGGDLADLRHGALHEGKECGEDEEAQEAGAGPVDLLEVAGESCRDALQCVSTLIYQAGQHCRLR
jgi:hypothetical protein